MDSASMGATLGMVGGSDDRNPGDDGSWRPPRSAEHGKGRLMEVVRQPEVTSVSQKMEITWCRSEVIAHNSGFLSAKWTTTGGQARLGTPAGGETCQLDVGVWPEVIGTDRMEAMKFVACGGCLLGLGIRGYFPPTWGFSGGKECLGSLEGTPGSTLVVSV